MSFKGYFLFNCIQYLICISLNEYLAILFFEYFKTSLVKVHFFKDLVGFPFLCHFHLRKKRCGKDILKKKNKTKRRPQLFVHFFFPTSPAQSVVDFCLRRRCCGQCVNKKVYRLQRTSVQIDFYFFWIQSVSVLDSSRYSSIPLSSDDRPSEVGKHFSIYLYSPALKK